MHPVYHCESQQCANSTTDRYRSQCREKIQNRCLPHICLIDDIGTIGNDEVESFVFDIWIQTMVGEIDARHLAERVDHFDPL